MGSHKQVPILSKHLYWRNPSGKLKGIKYSLRWQALEWITKVKSTQEHSPDLNTLSYTFATSVCWFPSSVGRVLTTQRNFPYPSPPLSKPTFGGGWVGKGLTADKLEDNSEREETAQIAKIIATGIEYECTLHKSWLGSNPVLLSVKLALTGGESRVPLHPHIRFT